MGKHYKKNRLTIFKYKLQDKVDKIIATILDKACATIEWIDDKIEGIVFKINEYVSK